jgi:hypothetical protein
VGLGSEPEAVVAEVAAEVAGAAEVVVAVAVAAEVGEEAVGAAR